MLRLNLILKSLAVVAEYNFNFLRVMSIVTAIFLQQPEIYLELEPDKLLKAMSLVKSMKGLKIKLSKINGQVKIDQLASNY